MSVHEDVCVQWYSLLRQILLLLQHSHGQESLKQSLLPAYSCPRTAEGG